MGTANDWCGSGHAETASLLSLLEKAMSVASARCQRRGREVVSSPVHLCPGSWTLLRAGLPFARPTSERSAPEEGEPTDPRGLRALADRARPHPRPAPSRWLQSASRLRPGEEAPGVAKGSGSRERRSLTYFPRRQAHAYLPSERGQGGSRGIARAATASPRHRAGRPQVRAAGPAGGWRG